MLLLIVSWKLMFSFFFFFSSRRRHTRSLCDWSSDVCSSDLRGLLEIEGHIGDRNAAIAGVQHSESIGDAELQRARLQCRNDLTAAGHRDQFNLDILVLEISGIARPPEIGVDADRNVADP